jgi:hypothetical protein
LKSPKESSGAAESPADFHRRCQNKLLSMMGVQGALIGSFAYNTVVFGAPDRIPPNEFFDRYRKEGKWREVPPAVVAAMMHRFGKNLPEWLSSYVIAYFRDEVVIPRGRKPVARGDVRDDFIRWVYVEELARLRAESSPTTASHRAAGARSERFDNATHRRAALRVADCLPQHGFSRLGIKTILNIVSAPKKSAD